MAKPIKNGVAYPQVFKSACVRDFKAGTTTINKLAIERNVAAVTLAKWVDDAGITRPKRRRALATIVVKGSKNSVVKLPDGKMYYQGKIFKAQ